jgi:gamma-glutamylputrescine oxidase
MPSTGYIDSYYAASAQLLEPFPTLQGEQQADVCIIGGGYTGLSSALHLRDKGYSVVLLEAERVGWGASGRNGGHASTGQRNDQDELEQRVGRDLAHKLWHLGLEGVDTVCGLVDRFAIDCDLKEGDLHVASKAAHIDELRAYSEKLQQEYQYEKVRFVAGSELHEMTSSRRYHAGVLDTGGRHLHPLNYALGLARGAVAEGAQIYENSRVTSYSEGDTVTVHTAQGQVRAKFLVLACNGYLERLCPPAARKIMPINNYVLATEPLPKQLARSLIRDDVAMSDSLFVINYWKLSGDNRLLFGGGETYTRRFPADIKGFVRNYMLRAYPELADTRIDYGWGGTLAITMNRMPVFGRLQPNILYAQGYSGHGVTIATLAGKLMAEAIAGTAERFDIMASVPNPTFPGGTLLRWPGLVLGMLWYAMLDKL